MIPAADDDWEAVSDPSQPHKKFRRLGSYVLRHQTLFLVVLGIIGVLGIVFLYDMLRPRLQQMSRSDIDKTIEQALESIPRLPSVASIAYAVIRPSLVIVEARTSEDAGENAGALGTGVVIVDTGIILTSLHIIRDAAAIRIFFADGAESEALVVTKQPENDLAILRALIVPDDLIPATLASSAMLRVGDEVVAVGNPFGIINSVSAGVVSGLKRSYTFPESELTLENLIQFDAAVNPGNSGGPLLNQYGEVVGIVTALLNPSDQEFFVGIGFAVPIETAATAAGPPPY